MKKIILNNQEINISDAQYELICKIVRVKTPEVSLENFEKIFTETFNSLDLTEGGYNRASLVDLRAQMSQFSRSEFDQNLKKLREKKYWLSDVDGGTYPLTADEKAAGIRENGELLIYAHRKR